MSAADTVVALAVISAVIMFLDYVVNGGNDGDAA